MSSRNPLLPVLLLLLAAIPSRAQAEDYNYEGERSTLLFGNIRTYLFGRLVDPYDFERAGASLHLGLRGGTGRPASFFALVDLRLDSRSSNSRSSESGDGVGELSVRPIEIYVDLLGRSLDARLGAQYVIWGRAAWMAPTDVLTAWDFGNMASEIEDYRLAPFGVRLGWYPIGELHLDLVWLPVFTPNRLSFAPPTEMAGMPVRSLAPRIPEPTPMNSEIGLRLSQPISRLALDWSLVGFRGFEKMPRFSLIPTIGEEGQPTAFDWEQRFDRLTMVGADLAKALGPFVFIAEGAYKHTQDLDDYSVSSSRLEYVAGLDAIVSERFDLGLHYMGRHILDRGSEIDPSQHGAPHQSFVEETTTHSAALRLRGELSQTIGAQLVAVLNVTYVDAFSLGFLWWDIADAVQARAGIVGFTGRDEETPYARQREESRVFVELKVSF